MLFTVKKDPESESILVIRIRIRIFEKLVYPYGSGSATLMYSNKSLSIMKFGKTVPVTVKLYSIEQIIVKGINIFIYFGNFFYGYRIK